MIFSMFLTMASLLSYVNRSNVGIWSNKTNQFVGDKIGNVLYYEGTLDDINGDSSGSASMTLKLTGASNTEYTVYAYQTYSDNIHFGYSYSNNDINEHFNLKLWVSVSIGYSSTNYFNLNRYYDYVNQVYSNESSDNNQTWVQSIWPSPDYVHADEIWFKLTFSFTPISQEELEGFNGGYDNGYDDGYSTGYNDGLNASNFSFMNLFASIADTPILMIRSLFSFDLFGMSVLTVVLSLLTALIIIGIVRKFGK